LCAEAFVLLCVEKKAFFATQKGEYRAISNTAAQAAEKMGRKLKKTNNGSSHTHEVAGANSARVKNTTQRAEQKQTIGSFLYDCGAHALLGAAVNSD
jgi:hypothetical protein